MTLSQGAEKPLLTLDAVRVSLRKLDASSDATYKKSASLIQTGMSTTCGRSRGRSPSIRGRGRGGRVRNSPRESRDAPNISCYVCKGPHRVINREDCHLKWKAYKHEIGVAAAENFRNESPPQASGSGTSNNRGSNPNTGISFWAEPPNDNTTFTKVTWMTKLQSSPITVTDAIIDGGATSTVIGIKEYHNVCDELNILPSIQELDVSDPRWHAFGLSGNSSKTESIIGKAKVPIPCGKGRFLVANVMIVDCQVPFIIAKPTLASWEAMEAHGENYIEVTCSTSRVRLPTYIADDGHSYLPLRQHIMAYNIAESLICSKLNIAELTAAEGRKLIDDIHTKTHLRPASLRLLLSRNQKWLPELWSYAHEILDNCDTCVRTGDPLPSRKISLTKLHAEYNGKVYIDLLFGRMRGVRHIPF